MLAFDEHLPATRTSCVNAVRGNQDSLSRLSCFSTSEVTIFPSWYILNSGRDLMLSLSGTNGRTEGFAHDVTVAKPPILREKEP